MTLRHPNGRASAVRVSRPHHSSLAWLYERTGLLGSIQSRGDGLTIEVVRVRQGAL